MFMSSRRAVEQDVSHGDRSRRIAGRGASRVAPRPAASRRTSDARAAGDHETVEAEHDDGADHGHDEACRLALVVETEHAAKPAAQHRPDDTEDDGDDDAARIVAGHDHLRHDTHDETEDDPEKNVHGALLFAVFRGGLGVTHGQRCRAGATHRAVYFLPLA
jgi:hypothetical protein